ncbi:acyl-CoA dehydrogenase family protein [Amphritea balenae]|uniref:Acyl-CoA dehydrogenase n=1 Tax=Amphritea balenae TaxID=452629 RepID=A0A3P1SX56_9GAMM|nr:acyl-CoA dehydrogenase family protein [Amphritea balenae]RRD01116.1 acyl-CoA dehydrogenase [Amphritea balenae]GGK59800.1 acyl-CoA dehydrogenase [Amphritea balenae]
MDFELNEDQVAFADMARTFAQNELAPNAGEWDLHQTFPVEVLKAAGELGFCGLYSHEDVGGLGMSRLDSSIIFEQLAMGCTSTTAFITIHNMATWMISEFGAEDVRQQWCPELTAGEKLASYCLTEPNAGSDAASLKTSARRDGDDYILNGSKIFISGAGSTDCLVVMARTGVDGPKGISAFAIDANLPGITYGRKEEKMGWNSQPTRMITFEDVRIPASAILGQEGDGFKIAMRGLDGGRINIATCSIGTAQQALDKATEYMHERKQFGKTLSNFQALQFKLANSATELVAARQMVRMAASRLDNNHPDKTTYCAMAKRFATDVGFNVADEALQIFGGNGYIKEYPMERFLRDNRVHRILEGTNEIMNVIIARRLLLENAAAVL